MKSYRKSTNDGKNDFTCLMCISCKAEIKVLEILKINHIQPLRIKGLGGKALRNTKWAEQAISTKMKCRECGGNLHIKKILSCDKQIIIPAKNRFFATLRTSKDNELIFHHNDCNWCKSIRREDLIRFETPTEAMCMGYKPCKVCRTKYSSD